MRFRKTILCISKSSLVIRTVRLPFWVTLDYWLEIFISNYSVITWGFLVFFFSFAIKIIIYVFNLNLQKALERANEAKLEGNTLFGNGQFEEALSKYELALYYAPDTPSSVEIRSTCHSNRAVCFLKLVCFSHQLPSDF